MEGASKEGTGLRLMRLVRRETEFWSAEKSMTEFEDGGRGGVAYDA